MKKKMLGVFTIVICFVTIVMSFAFAYESREEAPIDMARYDHTSFISAELSISWGKAHAYGEIDPIENNRTTITVRLQRKEDGSWTTIKTWTGQNNNGPCDAGGAVSISSGYLYRTYVTGKVYSSAGSVIETVNKYSGTKP